LGVTSISASSSGSDVGVSLIDGSSSFRGEYRSVSAPGGPAAAPASAAGAGAGVQGAALGTVQRSHSAAPEVGGAVISPSQAREIGALLTRLTNENTQFLKARDAAVASRNEALNRAAALEAELELRQQQLRCGTTECTAGAHEGKRCASGMYKARFLCLLCLTRTMHFYQKALLPEGHSNLALTCHCCHCCLILPAALLHSTCNASGLGSKFRKVHMGRGLAINTCSSSSSRVTTPCCSHPSTALRRSALDLRSSKLVVPQLAAWGQQQQQGAAANAAVVLVTQTGGCWQCEHDSVCCFSQFGWHHSCLAEGVKRGREAGPPCSKSRKPHAYLFDISTPVLTCCCRVLLHAGC
jgi:hypothetical protein